MADNALRLRVAKEREALRLRPWQFAPSEVGDGPSPYSPGTMGHASWLEAQEIRRKMKAIKEGKTDDE